MASVQEPSESRCPTILVIESDADMRVRLATTLQQQGHIALTAPDGPSGMHTLFSDHPDLVILALNLPGMDGWTVLERIREATDIPIIIVSRKTERANRLRAFQLNVDDFIAKPFDPQELVLRVKVALDHSGSRQREMAELFDDGTLRIDGWNRSVTVGGRPVTLTPRELRLLIELARQPGRVVPYDDLLYVLPSASVDDAHVLLHSIVYRLRVKLEKALSGSNYILTQRAVGIRLNVK